MADAFQKSVDIEIRGLLGGNRIAVKMKRERDWDSCHDLAYFDRSFR